MDVLGLVACALLARAAQDAQPERRQTLTCAGMWRAELASPGGPLVFSLEIGEGSDGLHAHVIQGGERLAIPRCEVFGSELVLAFDHYDSHIRAVVVEHATALDGVWEKRRSATEWTRLSFHARLATAVTSPRASTVLPNQVAGRWRTCFDSSDDPAVAILSCTKDGELTGTILTTLGDYRYMQGTWASGALYLTCFDGSHAFLFRGRRNAQGRIDGDFWSGDRWHETFTAERDEHAELADPFGLTRTDANISLAKLSFPDLDGHVRSLGDAAFAGRARIVQLFGSWCPNCNDEAEYLAELDRRYRARGLAITGLAFELTGDFARDARQVSLYAQRHKIEFPLLVAGLSDKAQAAKAFPLLERVVAFPTTLFLRADGSVRAVHTGYSGPATGAEHEKLRQDFERLIEELLTAH